MPLDTEPFETLACCLNIVHRNSKVTKATRLRVTVVVRQVWVILSAMIVCKLENSFALSERLVLLMLISKEIQCKVCLLYTSPSPRD